MLTRLPAESGPGVAGRVRGRGWAYAGAVLGGAVSVAANVAHSYVPPDRLPAGAPAGAWAPQPGAVASAVFWPVFLLVAVEIIARVDWPGGARWVVLRFAGLLPVAVVAAVVSYRHMSGLLVFYGEDRLTTRIGPLAVDGLMIMATGALIATAAHRGTPAARTVPPAAPLVPARVPVPGPDVSGPGEAAAPVGDTPVPDGVPTSKLAVPHAADTTAADIVPGAPTDSDQAADPVALRADGHSLRAIAATTGLSVSTVRRRLAASNGHPARSAPGSGQTAPPPT
jgi:hypothetical protein